jgi:hypothetical protein
MWAHRRARALLKGSHHARAHTLRVRDRRGSRGEQDTPTVPAIVNGDCAGTIGFLSLPLVAQPVRERYCTGWPGPHREGSGRGAFPPPMPKARPR